MVKGLYFDQLVEVENLKMCQYIKLGKYLGQLGKGTT